MVVVERNDTKFHHIFESASMIPINLCKKPSNCNWDVGIKGNQIFATKMIVTSVESVD